MDLNCPTNPIFSNASPTIAVVGTASQTLLARLFQDIVPPAPSVAAGIKFHLEPNVSTLVTINASKVTVGQTPAQQQQLLQSVVQQTLQSREFLTRFVRATYLDLLTPDPDLTGGRVVPRDPLLTDGAGNVVLAPDPNNPGQTNVVWADPSAQGWVEFLAQTGSFDQMRLLILSSPEYRAAHHLEDNTRYVRDLYFRLLGRVVDLNSPELAIWTNAMNAGMSPTQVALAIYESNEGLMAEVNRIYMLFLKRKADPFGLATFTSLLASGGTENQIIQAIVNSSEYASASTTALPSP
jgi:hypothetical protein